MNKIDFLEHIKKTLIVSVQGVDEEPTNDPRFLAVAARAVIEAGAKTLRLSQTEHIKAILQENGPVPIIGLIKRKYEDSDIFITATKKEVDELLELNVEAIALDATLRNRPKGERVEDLIAYIRGVNPEVVIMADCDTEESILEADKLGFDIVSTTLRGYTEETKNKSKASDNNFELVRRISDKINAKFIYEGGLWSPEDAKEALDVSYAVVVGSAITRPHEIAKKYFEEMGYAKNKND